MAFFGISHLEHIPPPTAKCILGGQGCPGGPRGAFFRTFLAPKFQRVVTFDSKVWFPHSFFLNWSIFREETEGVWTVLGGCLEGVWNVSGMAWKVSGRPRLDWFGSIWIWKVLGSVWMLSRYYGECLERISNVSGKYMLGVWVVHVRCLEGVWRVSGRPLKRVWKVPGWCSLQCKITLYCSQGCIQYKITSYYSKECLQCKITSYYI